MGSKTKGTTTQSGEWEQLHARCAQTLRTSFHAASNEDIDDAVADGIESLLRGAPHHVLHTEPVRASWVLTAAKRILLRRLHRREREVSLENLLNEESSLAYTPITDLCQIEQGIDAEWFLRQLNSKDRAILQLSFTDFPKEQLAEMFQCSIKAIDERNRRSIRKLRRIAGVPPPSRATDFEGEVFK